MSLEQQVEVLSQNVANLTEILEKFLDSGAASIATAERPADHSEKKAPPKKKAAKKKAEPKAEGPIVDDGLDPEEANATGDSLSYDDDVKPAVLGAAKENRDVVVAALSRFGAKKATELPEEKYGEFLAMLEKGIADGVEAI